MALIKCTDCGKSISEDASVCPNCGCPMEKILAGLDRQKQDDIKKEQERQAQKDERMKAREERKQSFTPAKKKKIIVIVVVLLILGAGAGTLYWYLGIKKPRDEAYEAYAAKVSEYNTVVDAYNKDIEPYNADVEKVISANSEFEDHINSAQSTVDSGDEPYKAKTKDALSEIIKKARAAEIDAPETYDAQENLSEDQSLKSSSVDEIEAASQKVEASKTELTGKDEEVKAASISLPDYMDHIEALDKGKSDLEDSYAIRKQITNPKQKFVMKRISKVKPIVNMAPVTEKNDPNGHLGKKGGYTSTIYMSCKWLSTRSLSGNKLIDEGTSAGGAIEVYRNVDDAKRRDSYLGGFDGTAFSSGYHEVLGTMVLRASDDLPYSKQKKLTKLMKKELTKLIK